MHQNKEKNELNKQAHIKAIQDRVLKQEKALLKFQTKSNNNKKDKEEMLMEKRQRALQKVEADRNTQLMDGMKYFYDL